MMAGLNSVLGPLERTWVIGHSGYGPNSVPCGLNEVHVALLRVNQGPSFTLEHACIRSCAFLAGHSARPVPLTL